MSPPTGSLWELTSCLVVPSSFLYTSIPEFSANGLLCLLPASCWFLDWLILQPWGWRGRVPLNRQLSFNRLHRVISQKTEVFITTTVRTWNPTLRILDKYYKLWQCPSKLLSPFVTWSLPISNTLISTLKACSFLRLPDVTYAHKAPYHIIL
jgi:hypothetical protein